LTQIKAAADSRALRSTGNGDEVNDNSKRLSARWNCIRLLVLRNHAGVGRFLLAGSAKIGEQRPFDGRSQPPTFA